MKKKEINICDDLMKKNYFFCVWSDNYKYEALLFSRMARLH